MDRGKGIFSSFLSAIRPNNKSMNPVLAMSEEHAKANAVFAVSGDDERKTLDELIASWKAQPDVHFHSFSSEELMTATGNFSSNHIIGEDGYYAVHKGFFGKQPVLIKKLKRDTSSFPLPPSQDIDYVNIRDTVIASQLSSHGSSLKFMGCCPEISAQVFEYEGNAKFLSDGLYQGDGEKTESLPWRNRVSVAQDIANALVILHNSFSTPVILRDLKPSNILLDKSGTAKLLDFSLCIEIPQGESQVEDAVMGTYGFAEPQYIATGVLTEKADVFSFGVVLLELLTGQRAVDARRGNRGFLHEWVGRSRNKKGKLNKDVVDPRMVGGDIVEREREFRAFASLALRCTQESRKDRPRMIDIAAELARIQSTASPDH